jgi:pilus assembly protein CpaB
MRRRAVLLAVAVLVAVVGASLIVIYVKGQSPTTAAAGNSPGTSVRILTAAGQISAGETVEQAQAEGKFELRSVPTSSVVTGALSSVDPIAGMVALSPVYAGEQVVGAMFGTTAAAEVALPVPKGKVAVSVELTDPGRVAGFVTPGSHVAIFESFQGTSGSAGGLQTGFTRVIVPNVEVLAVGPTTLLTGAGTSLAKPSDDVDTTILTIAVDQRQGDEALFGAQAGTISFGLLGTGTRLRPDPGVTLRDLTNCGCAS